MSPRILVITALATELGPERLPEGVEIAYCSIGKINATLVTLDAVTTHRPDLIVNYGTVGGINPTLSGLVGIGRVIQRDMIAEPLAPRGQTPFSNWPDVYVSPYGVHTCATGDSFVTAPDPWLGEQGVDVVDMELFAIAATAHRLDLPWCAYKYITDAADDAAAANWDRKVSHGQSDFLAILDELRR